MKVRYSIRVVIRDDKPIKLNGNVPINFFIILNGVLIKIPTGKEINPKHFDSKKYKVVKCPLATELNRYFSNRVEAFNKWMMKQEMLNKNVNRESVKDYFNGSADKTFYEFWEEQIEVWKNVKAPSTIMYYSSVLKILKEYRANLNFSDIDIQFVEKFDKFLTNTKKNSENGKFNKHKCFKAVIRSAMRRGYIEKNPYSDFTIRSQEGKRMFLTSEEVKKIMELEITPDKQYLDKIRDTFLFSCFCGLRFSDMESLTWNHITEEAICIRMKKTNKEVTIPLIPQTKRLLTDNNYFRY